MRTFRLLLAGALATLLAAAAVRAEEPAPAEAPTASLDVLLDTIRANRKALIAVNLNLDPEEAARFWPLYDRYQKEMNVFGDRLVEVIQSYTTQFHDLSDDAALKLMRDYLSIEADRLQVRRRYLDQFAKILPGRTLARFYQIENKMDAVTRYDLAATIPVVDEASAPPAK